MIYGFNADEVFQMAIEIEDNGKRFYEDAMDIIEDPRVKDVFAMLAEAEAEHKRRFADLKASLPESARESTVWDPDNEAGEYIRMTAAMHVFRTADSVEEALSRVRTAKEALKLAMGFEKDSIVFFLTMQDATAEKKGRERIGQLVEEEKQHLKTLAIALRQLEH